LWIILPSGWMVGVELTARRFGCSGELATKNVMGLQT